MSSIPYSIPHNGRSGGGSSVGGISLLLKRRRWIVLFSFAGLCIFYSTLHGHHSSSTSNQEDDIGLPVENLPKVDRTALDKLRLLEIHLGGQDSDQREGEDEEGDDNDILGSSTRRKALSILDRPPVVAEIPEPEKFIPNANGVSWEKVPAEVIDFETCGARDGEPCRFLVPAWLGEQETKAQQHLYQLGLLALALNRTLVLPNVSKSRLGTCYRNPFSFYYSPTALSSLGIPTISQEDFLLYTLQRDPPPTAQIVSMQTAKPGVYPSGALEIDSSSDPFTISTKPNRNLCLRNPKSSRLNFNAHSPLSIYPPEGYHKSETTRLGFGQSVVNTLLSNEVGMKSSRRDGTSSPSSTNSLSSSSSLPDVFAFNYELRFSIMSPTSPSLLRKLPFEPPPPPLPFSHFPYSQTWSDLANSISTSLYPFISIHWRTETLSPQNLAPCAESLLDKVFELKRLNPEVENVYLATDYPIEQLDPSLGSDHEGLNDEEDGSGGGEVAHSGTFAKVVTNQHHKAMKKFLIGFEKRSKALNRVGRGGGGMGGLRLTTFAKEQNRIGSNPKDRLELPMELEKELRNLTLSSLPPSPSSTSFDDNFSDSDSDSEESNRPWRLNLGRLDSGLLGILDKLIVTRSQLFLTGVPGQGSSTVGACAKLSSFTNQLIGAREGLWEEQRVERERFGEGERRKEGDLWNTVQHWSLDGSEVD